MSSNEKDNNNNHSSKEKKLLNEKVTISEEELLKLIERARNKTASECHSFFEKFHKEELEFQRKVELENREFERQREHEEREYRKKNERSERWWKGFFAILALVGFYFFFVTNIETEKGNTQRAANEHKIDLLREDITEKKQLLKKGSDAIGNMRQVNYEILLRCKYNHPYTQEEQNLLRFTVGEKVIDAFALFPYVFNDEALNKVKELVLFDSGIADICEYKGNYDVQVRNYKTEIFDLGNKLIKKDEEEIRNLK